MLMIKRLLFVLCLVVASAVAGYSQIVPEGYKGDINAAQVINCKFTSNIVAVGVSVPTALGGSPVIKAYKNNDTSTESTAGITFTGSFDGIAGLNNVNVDTSADGTFYSAGSEFTLIITTGTLGGTSVAGSVLCGFSIADRYGSLAGGSKILANAVQLNGTNLTARDIGASVLLSNGTGTGQLSFTSGIVKSNLSQVNGGSTGSTAGKLELSNLWISASSGEPINISSPDTYAAVIIQGGHADGTYTGAPGIIVRGGDASATKAGGASVLFQGGSANGTTVAGPAMVAVSGQVDGVGSGAPESVLITGAAYSDGNYTIAGGGNPNALTLTPGGTGKGLVGSTLAIPKGVAYTNFTYKLVLASDNKSPITGASGRTCKISKDGGAFADCANSTNEIGLGWYKVTLSSTEMTADSIVVRFTATSANTTEFQIGTNP